MLVAFHFWKIENKSIRNSFNSDWHRVTREIAKPSGNRFAILLELTRSNFFSLAVWKSEESWKRWKSDMKSLKERNNYRKYKTRESLLFKIGK